MTILKGDKIKVKRKAAIKVIIAIIIATCLVGYLSKNWCNVHHIPLIPDTVEIIYGLIVPSEGYLEAESEHFPNANTYVSGGCVIYPNSKKMATTFYCLKCRKAKQDWEKQKSEAVNG